MHSYKQILPEGVTIDQLIAKRFKCEIWCHPENLKLLKEGMLKGEVIFLNGIRLSSDNFMKSIEGIDIFTNENLSQRVKMDENSEETFPAFFTIFKMPAGHYESGGWKIERE